MTELTATFRNFGNSPDTEWSFTFMPPLRVDVALHGIDFPLCMVLGVSLNPHALITTLLCRSCANVTQNWGLAIGKTIEFYGFSIFHDSCFVYVLCKKKRGLFLPKCYSCLVNTTCRLKNPFWPTDLHQAWHNVTGYFSGRAQWLVIMFYAL